MYAKKNLGDSFTKRIDVRISDSNYIFLNEVSNLLGISPSEYVRMLINSSMVSYSQKVMGANYENEQGNIND